MANDTLKNISPVLRGNNRVLFEKQKKERERMAMIQAQIDAMRFRTANQFPGAEAYTGNPDSGIVPVGPVEALIGGAGLGVAKVGAKGASSIFNLLKSEKARKLLSRARTSFVRPGYSGKGAPPTFTRVPGGGAGKWKKPDTFKRNPDPPAYNPSLGPASYLTAGGVGAAALLDSEEAPTVQQALLAEAPTTTAIPTAPTNADAVGLLDVDPNYAPSGNWTPAAEGGTDNPSLPPQLQELAVEAVVGTESPVQELDPDANTVSGVDVSQIAPEKQQELERVYGKYTYSPKERHNKFMEQLNSIYMKAAWLDVIASLTGGTSQSAQYISRATSKLEMMAKFDQEERVYNIWRDVYHDENGTYDPPKSKKEAAERARRLGASPEETQKIYGWSEEQDDLVSWWRKSENEQGYETTTTPGKKEPPARGTGEEWMMGSPPDRLTAPPTTVGKNVWAVAPGETVASLVPESIAMQPGWTKEQTGGLLQDLAAETQQLVRSDDPNAWSKGVARWEIYFAGSQKDPITQSISMMQPGQLRQAAEEQMLRIYASLNKTPPGATGGGDIPIVSGQPKTKEEAYIMARGDSKNSHLSDEEVKADVEEYWSKRMGQSQ